MTSAEGAAVVPDNEPNVPVVAIATERAKRATSDVCNAVLLQLADLRSEINDMITKINDRRDEAEATFDRLSADTRAAQDFIAVVREHVATVNKLLENPKLIG